MRRLIALLIFSVSFFMIEGWRDAHAGRPIAEKQWGIAALASGETSYKGDALLSYTEFVSGGSTIIWPPGYTQIGHEQGVPRTWAPNRACASVEPVIHVIELSSVSAAAIQEFWNQMVLSEECKFFPHGLRFWPDEVMAELRWGDGDLMYVVRGHDSKDMVVYVWVPADEAAEIGIPPPGTSNAVRVDLVDWSL